ncbi:hypothetical protein ABIA33_005630 [Streptacidiphilus sp. MAP12-16]
MEQLPPAALAGVVAGAACVVFGATGTGTVRTGAGATGATVVGAGGATDGDTGAAVVSEAEGVLGAVVAAVADADTGMGVLVGAAGTDEQPAALSIAARATRASVRAGRARNDTDMWGLLGSELVRTRSLCPPARQ